MRAAIRLWLAAPHPLKVAALIVLLVLAGAAAAGERVARHPNGDELRVWDSPCVHAATLALIPPKQRPMFQKAQAMVAGKKWFGCWIQAGDAILVLYEDKEKGIVDAREFREVPSSDRGGCLRGGIQGAASPPTWKARRVGGFLVSAASARAPGAACAARQGRTSSTGSRPPARGCASARPSSTAPSCPPGGADPGAAAGEGWPALAGVRCVASWAPFERQERRLVTP